MLQELSFCSCSNCKGLSAYSLQQSPLKAPQHYIHVKPAPPTPTSNVRLSLFNIYTYFPTYTPRANVTYANAQPLRISATDTFYIFPLYQILLAFRIWLFLFSPLRQYEQRPSQLLQFDFCHYVQYISTYPSNSSGKMPLGSAVTLNPIIPISRSCKK